MNTPTGLSWLELSAGDEALAELYAAAEAEKESKDSDRDDVPEHVESAAK